MKILTQDIAKYYQILSLKRGHCIFTSLLVKHGRLLFLEDHIERLLLGADFLFPRYSWNLKHLKLQENILEYTKKLEDDYYLRITIFDDVVHFEIQELNLSLAGNQNLIKCCLSQHNRSENLRPSYLKISNYLEQDLELELARKNGFHEVLFFDNLDRLTEASTSNVFIVNDLGLLKTPPISSLVLDGVLRKNILKCADKIGIPTVVDHISKLELEKAQEIWLTNSIKGMRLVSQFGMRELKSKSLFLKVQNIFGQFGELL